LSRRLCLTRPPPSDFYPLSLHDALPIFPPLTLFSLASLGVGFQQFLHAYLQRGFFPPRTPGNGSWQNVSCLTPLLQVALHGRPRSEEHTSELQSPDHLVCRLLLEKIKTT